MENLITLTAGQHKSKAHPNSNENKINSEYQCICLLSKLKTIKKELENNGTSQYSKHKFTYILSIGLNKKNLSVNLSSDEIENIIKEHHKYT